MKGENNRLNMARREQVNIENKRIVENRHTNCRAEKRSGKRHWGELDAVMRIQSMLGLEPNFAIKAFEGAAKTFEREKGKPKELYIQLIGLVRNLVEREMHFKSPSVAESVAASKASANEEVLR